MPVSSRFILACRDTLAAGFVERMSGLRLSKPAGPAPAEGVTVQRWVAPDLDVIRLDPAPIAMLHAEAIGMAWRDGAWDIAVTRHTPLAGPELGIVAGPRRYADADLQEALLDAAERGRLVTWLWRPMAAGTDLMRRAHQAKDLSLLPDGSRAGAPPPDLAGVDWRRQGGCAVTIRLGQSAISPGSTARRPAQRPPAPPRQGPLARATRAQRQYIIDLRHRAGRYGEPLPAALTRAEASQLIDQLKEQP